MVRLSRTSMLLRSSVQSTLLLALLLIGCSRPGHEFIGKWANSANSVDTMIISRNGDQFQITGPDNGKINATFNNGILQIPVADSTMDLRYIKATDTIQAPSMFGTVEYKRVK